MIHPLRYFIAASLVGLGATLLIDLWALFLRKALKVPSLNYCFLGRWILHMPGGTLVHQSIADAPRKPYECPLGWVAHYLIGTALALGFVLLASGTWLEQPTLLPALAFGVVTVLMPFLVLQPALGLGVASSRTPNPGKARLKSLMTHIVFGVGLYLSALVLAPVLFRS
jgi:hypothetical protein